MNLAITAVMSTSESGCVVRPVDGRKPYSTRYSRPMVKYDIPVRPGQFVIVDLDTTPPETIFRFSRARVTQVAESHLALEDDGKHFTSVRAQSFAESPEIGDEVVLVGWNDENRRVVDIVLDDRPAHPERLGANWFPVMRDSEARALE